MAAPREDADCKDSKHRRRLKNSKRSAKLGSNIYDTSPKTLNKARKVHAAIAAPCVRAGL